MILIPEHLQIETINGVCTAQCTMCTFNSWTRKSHVMDYETFKKILKKFLPFKEYIRFLTFHGCGEPLLDKELHKKIAIAKILGFKGTGFASNCTELTKKKTLELLEAKLDTIICSIDGINKKTHESIRIGTNFDVVISNVQNFIKIRNEEEFKTRILIRFISQEKNKEEYPKFVELWEKRINKDLGDAVIKFDIHNWGDKLKNYENICTNKEISIQNMICDDIFERLYIYSNGDVALCCSDDNGYYKMGNVIHDDPIKIYNNKIFNHYRKMIMEGNILKLKYCENCTIPHSRSLKDY